MTRYALGRRGESEANNELKVWLLGSDRPSLSTVTGERRGKECIDTSCCPGAMSASEERDSMAVKMFPLQRKIPESAK